MPALACGVDRAAKRAAPSAGRALELTAREEGEGEEEWSSLPSPGKRVRACALFPCDLHLGCSVYRAPRPRDSRIVRRRVTSVGSPV